MTAIPSLSENQLQAIANVIGDTSSGLTGSEIGGLLGRSGIEDVSPGITKRHRLFNALLNVPDREEVYRLIAERFPDERPQTLAVKWLGEIFKDKQAGLKLTPSSLCILQYILEGEDFEHARPVLGDLFHCASETEEEKVRKAWTQLQSVDMFQPLVGKTAKAS